MTKKVVVTKSEIEPESESESEKTIETDPLSAVLARFFEVRVNGVTKSIAEILQEINCKLNLE